MSSLARSTASLGGGGGGGGEESDGGSESDTTVVAESLVRARRMKLADTRTTLPENLPPLVDATALALLANTCLMFEGRDLMRSAEFEQRRAKFAQIIRDAVSENSTYSVQLLLDDELLVGFYCATASWVKMRQEPRKRARLAGRSAGANADDDESDSDGDSDVGGEAVAATSSSTLIGAPSDGSDSSDDDGFNEQKDVGEDGGDRLLRYAIVEFFILAAYVDDAKTLLASAISSFDSSEFDRMQIDVEDMLVALYEPKLVELGAARARSVAANRYEFRRALREKLEKTAPNERVDLEDVARDIKRSNQFARQRDELFASVVAETTRKLALARTELASVDEQLAAAATTTTAAAATSARSLSSSKLQIRRLRALAKIAKYEIDMARNDMTKLERETAAPALDESASGAARFAAANANFAQAQAAKKELDAKERRLQITIDRKTDDYAAEKKNLWRALLASARATLERSPSGVSDDLALVKRRAAADIAKYEMLLAEAELVDATHVLSIARAREELAARSANPEDMDRAQEALEAAERRNSEAANANGHAKAAYAMAKSALETLEKRKKLAKGAEPPPMPALAPPNPTAPPAATAAATTTTATSAPLSFLALMNKTLGSVKPAATAATATTTIHSGSGTSDDDDDDDGDGSDDPDEIKWTRPAPRPAPVTTQSTAGKKRARPRQSPSAAADETDLEAEERRWDEHLAQIEALGKSSSLSIADLEENKARLEVWRKDHKKNIRRFRRQGNAAALTRETLATTAIKNALRTLNRKLKPPKERPPPPPMTDALREAASRAARAAISSAEARLGPATAATNPPPSDAALAEGSDTIDLTRNEDDIPTPQLYNGDSDDDNDDASSANIAPSDDENAMRAGAEAPAVCAVCGQRATVREQSGEKAAFCGTECWLVHRMPALSLAT